jgi:hypothetical protein
MIEPLFPEQPANVNAYVPIKPEPIDKMRLRVKDAVTNVIDPRDESTWPSMDDLRRVHFFDFDDGLRLSLTRELVPSATDVAGLAELLVGTKRPEDFRPEVKVVVRVCLEKESPLDTFTGCDDKGLDSLYKLAWKRLWDLLTGGEVPYQKPIRLGMGQPLWMLHADIH